MDSPDNRSRYSLRSRSSSRRVSRLSSSSTEWPLSLNDYVGLIRFVLLVVVFFLKNYLGEDEQGRFLLGKRPAETLDDLVGKGKFHPHSVANLNNLPKGENHPNAGTCPTYRDIKSPAMNGLTCGETFRNAVVDRD